MHGRRYVAVAHPSLHVLRTTPTKVVQLSSLHGLFLLYKATIVLLRFSLMVCRLRNCNLSSRFSLLTTFNPEIAHGIARHSFEEQATLILAGWFAAG